MITKTFQYKGQMIKYYNKVRKNPNIDFCLCGLFYDVVEYGAYTVKYRYKK